MKEFAMKCRIRYIWVLLILFNSVLYAQKVNNRFIPPLKIPLYLSASFGELRGDHFHSGIDIKTQGVTGKEVVAADDGFVYLLLVSPGGFGRAIFVRHPSGFSTVYGHLERYAPLIEEYVKNRQYESKSFPVTIYPPADRFKVSKGEVIGFSGNSGSSSGPHLHFEVRKSDGEKPVNPLIFNFGIEDNVKPVIERLAIYPGAKNTIINGAHEKSIIKVIGSDGNYTLPDEITLNISGLTGFGMTSYDYMNSTNNRFGINLIELQIDTMPWFSYEINEFSFSETRYINAHIDYEAYQRNSLDIERTFVLPNDKLSLYKNFMANGYFDFNDDLIHRVRIIVTDGAKNKSVLKFNVKASPLSEQFKSEEPDSNIIIMPFGKSNMFVSNGIKVNIPAGALYDTLYFRYSVTEGNGKYLSAIHRVNDRFTPLQKSINISIKPDLIPPGRGSKLAIVSLDKNRKMNYVGGTLSDGYLTAEVLVFGDYSVSMDTIPPEIFQNGLAQQEDLTGKSEIRIKITDNLSGIKAYTGTIDGNWALFEYDAKNDLLIYKFDSQRIVKGIRHKLSLRVSDNRDNYSILNREFIW